MWLKLSLTAQAPPISVLISVESGVCKMLTHVKLDKALVNSDSVTVCDIDGLSSKWTVLRGVKYTV